MRLFAAVSIPENIKQALARELPRFAYLKFFSIPEENWHITVKFIGEVEAERVPAIRELVGSIAARFKPFELEVRDAGFVNPRAFGFNLERSPKLFALFRLLDDQLGSRGLSPRERFRTFTPHITVGRKNPPVIGEHLHTVRHFDLKARTPLRFAVSAVNLMESTLRAEGSVYQTVANFPLLT